MNGTRDNKREDWKDHWLPVFFDGLRDRMLKRQEAQKIGHEEFG